MSKSKQVVPELLQLKFISFRKHVKLMSLRKLCQNRGLSKTLFSLCFQVVICTNFEHSLNNCFVNWGVVVLNQQIKQTNKNKQKLSTVNG